MIIRFDEASTISMTVLLMKLPGVWYLSVKNILPEEGITQQKKQYFKPR
jgi:hypothetical protein